MTQIFDRQISGKRLRLIAVAKDLHEIERTARSPFDLHQEVQQIDGLKPEIGHEVIVRPYGILQFSNYRCQSFAKYSKSLRVLHLHSSIFTPPICNHVTNSAEAPRSLALRPTTCQSPCPNRPRVETMDRMKRLTMIAFLIALVSPSAWAADYLSLRPNPPDDFAGKAEVDGIRLQDYKDFQSWNLVTVRFRRDTGEQRFTYANPLAWKTLSAGKINYPDGSVFIKVAYGTTDDPSFASSSVPSKSMRVQVMVKAAQKYKDQDGWGYAIFSRDGVSVGGNSHDKIMACVACHRIVPERGYVFSEKMPTGFFQPAPPVWNLPSRLSNTFIFQTSNLRMSTA